VYFVALNRFKPVRGIADETGGARDTKHSAVAYPDGNGGLHAKRAIEYTVDIMPLPAKVERGDGSLKIDGEFPHRVCRLPASGASNNAGLAPRVGQIQAANRAGYSHANKRRGPATVEIITDHESKAIQELGRTNPTGGYDANWGEAARRQSLGTLRGLQTFLQLIAITPEGFSIPGLHIEDRPRFPWRGLMIDSGRHFITARRHQTQSGWNGGP